MKNFLTKKMYATRALFFAVGVTHANEVLIKTYSQYLVPRC